MVGVETSVLGEGFSCDNEFGDMWVGSGPAGARRGTGGGEWRVPGGCAGEGERVSVRGGGA